MTEETVVPGILKKHLAPQGKIGFLVVEEVSLRFVWEDDQDNILDADPEHPIVILPERYHHVKIRRKVQFRVEFYQNPTGYPLWAHPKRAIGRVKILFSPPENIKSETRL
jgi:tellurite resistance-related uncharacterized protein